VTAKGHALIDRELYLPLDWCEDRDRRRAAGIPESVRFQTKPELARRMLARLWNAQVPIAWVVADTVYGNNLDLRTWLEDRGYPYVVSRPMQLRLFLVFGEPLVISRKSATLVSKIVRRGGKGCQVHHCFPFQRDWKLPLSATHQKRW
jgi:hypothetical protein